MVVAGAGPKFGIRSEVVLQGGGAVVERCVAGVAFGTFFVSFAVTKMMYIANIDGFRSLTDRMQTSHI